MVNLKISAHYVNEESQEQLAEVIAPLTSRIYDDPAFKAEFMANPGAVIERETEIDEKLPEGFRFVVIDKSDPFAVYITVPVNEDSLELSEQELELVAGGIGFLGINFSKCNKDCTVTEAPKEDKQ